MPPRLDRSRSSRRIPDRDREMRSDAQIPQPPQIDPTGFHIPPVDSSAVVTPEQMTPAVWNLCAVYCNTQAYLLTRDQSQQAVQPGQHVYPFSMDPTVPVVPTVPPEIPRPPVRDRDLASGSISRGRHSVSVSGGDRCPRCGQLHLGSCMRQWSCHYCGQPGHFQRECPLRNAAIPTSPPPKKKKSSWFSRLRPRGRTSAAEASGSGAGRVSRSQFPSGSADRVQSSMSTSSQGQTSDDSDEEIDPYLS